jgi:hypothetical protein
MSDPFTLDLLFLWDKNDPMAYLEAWSHITLRNVQLQDYKETGEKIVLTNRCVTLRELEVEIDRLHRELEQVREIARKRYGELEAFKNAKSA